MSKQAAGGEFGRSGLEWSYGGEQFERNRRVTVLPYEMLGDILSLSAEARGVLLTVFCRYWPHDCGPDVELVRLEHRMTKERFARILAEITGSGIIAVKASRLIPMRSFGAASEPKVRRENTREMPSDWQVKRAKIFARDGYACVYCGSGGLELHCDHVMPVSRGGSHEIENLVTACAVCNLAKGAKTVAEWRPDIAEAWGR